MRHRELNAEGGIITADDVMEGAAALVSVFIEQPQFQGQTKEKLTSTHATRLVESALRDRFDHFLAGDPAQADNLLALAIERALAQARARGVTGPAVTPIVLGEIAAATSGEAVRANLALAENNARLAAAIAAQMASLRD